MKKHRKKRGTSKEEGKEPRGRKNNNTKTSDLNSKECKVHSLYIRKNIHKRTYAGGWRKIFPPGKVYSPPPQQFFFGGGAAFHAG